MSSAESTRKSCWRDQFGPGETIQRVRPKESFEYIANPHRGTATFQRFNGDAPYSGWRWNDREGPFEFPSFRGDPETLRNDHYPRTALSYCRWIWADLEPRKGEIRWDVIDGALRAARERGQTLQMRLQPFIGNDTPEWYWALGGKAITESRKGAERREPDHNTPEWAQHWGDLIRAFGARYDGHPDLESFDIAFGGPCGEWGGNATAETHVRMTDIYLDSFRRTQLLGMMGTPSLTYTAGLKDRRIGWRADCYGDLRAEGRGAVPDHLCWNHMFDAYPMEVVLNGVYETWRIAPVTFESCWSVPYWYEKGWDIDWILEQGLKYHTTVFMPKSNPYPESWMEKLDAFDRRLGYRFVLRQMSLPLECAPGAEFVTRFWIDNVGVAPIYRLYRLALRFRQGPKSDVFLFPNDIRTWMPEHSWLEAKAVFPASIERGEVKVDVGIVDEATKQPRVRFAIRETDVDGWHPLTSMDAV